MSFITEMHRLNTILLLSVALVVVACKSKKHKTGDANPVQKNSKAIFYDSTVTDTTTIVVSGRSDHELFGELFLLSYLPEPAKMKGLPGSHVEKISEYPNWSKEDFDNIQSTSNGRFYVDTADRDFEKYWYNDKGLISRYEIKDFGDMNHSESIFTYNPDHSLAFIEINNVLSEHLKYKICTLIFENKNRLQLLRHAIIKDAK